MQILNITPLENKKNYTDEELIKSQEMIKELNKLYDIFNEIFFKNSLTKAFITIVTNSGRKNKRHLAYFTPKKWWNNIQHEIVVTGLSFNKDVFEIFSSFLHEMVHQNCYETNIKDVERNGRHNKNFKIEALKVNLDVYSSGNKNVGYGTKTSKKLEDYFGSLKKYINFEIFEKNENLITKNILLEAESKMQNFKNVRYKYKCLNCDFTFTNINDMNLNCNDCSDDLEKSVV